MKTVDDPASKDEPRGGNCAARAPQARAKAGKCPCCGRHAVRPIAQPGRVCRYRNTALTLPAELCVPTCRCCKHQILSFESAPGLGATLEATYRAELIRRAAVAITQLGRVCSQRKLEGLADLSQGYLSRLRAGDGVPSAALVSLMALLSAEPTRIEELDRYWALPLSPEPQVSRRRQRA